ncbi:MAG TPA: metallopeptidase TldD-related protein [Solirubrobacteraceae bacterium]
MRTLAATVRTPREIAERALELAGADMQVTVVRERSLLSRFARSAPTQATEVDDTSVEVLAVRDGQTAAATTNRLDDDALRATARAAELAALASARAGQGPYPGLAEPAAVRDHAGFDPETALLDPARAAAALREAFAVADEHGLEAFGAWTVGAVRTAIAATTGLALEDEVTDAFMKVVCRDAGGRSGYAAGTATSAAAIGATALARRAAGKVTAEPPAELAPGPYQVVLEPEAVGVLLEFLGALALNGLAHAEDRGALSGRLGTAVAAPTINLADSPRFPRTLPRAFDFEGVPKAPIPLLQDGVAAAVVHDRRSAAVAGGGARTTGHATAPGGSPWGPAPTNLVLTGGGARDLEELAAPIERGIYVTRLWYVNTVREKETLLTGMTRDGTFLIEDGKVSRPLRDVRFTDSVLRLLAATEALTSWQRLVTEGEFYGRRFAHGVVCPALRAGGFRVTGATE